MNSLFPMTPEQYEGYLKSAKWRAIRDLALKRDGYRCVDCRNKFNLQVHHLTYEHIGGELLADLKTLCRKCHGGKHKGDLIIKIIKLCCERFLSQPRSEDYNPRRLARCHGCEIIFEFEDIRFRYSGLSVFCERCIVDVRRILKNSKTPHYVEEIELYDPVAERLFG